MIDITGRILGAETVQRRFLTANDKIRGRVRTEVRSLGVDLQRRVKENKLTGQKLRVRTGRLRRSINMQVKEAWDSIQGSVGTNVSYGRRFELGGSWTENVRAHLRKVKLALNRDGSFRTQADVWHAQGNTGPATASQARRLVFAKKGAKKTIGGQFMVKAHSRKVNVKPRRFLQESLDEMRPNIRGRLLAAINGGL